MKKMAVTVSSVFLATSLGLAVVYLGACVEDSAWQRPKPNYSQSYADDEFKKGAERPPTAKTLYTMAGVMVNQGKDAHAEDVLRRLLRENPKFVPAYNSLAEIKMRQRKIDQAIQTLTKGLSISPGDPVLINNLGMCWMLRQDYHKALEEFTNAAGLKPENARYRANMAVALAFLGRDEEALSLYKQILPEDKAKYNLSIIQHARQR
ncbi:MAG: tetratricopeptide repeat protein [Planctomycetota bacterium]|jgi:Flp pilus assembly protein TadD